jgi:hypothetical protein
MKIRFHSAFLTILFILVICCLNGCKKNDAIVNPSGTEYTQDFETLWSHFDQEYCYFPMKSVDWKAQHDRYRPEIDTASSAESFISICTAMLAPLRDGHVYFTAPDGSYHSTRVSPYHANYDMNVYQSLYQKYGGEFIDKGLGYTVVDSILCIGILSWLDDNFVVADFDRILDSCKAMHGIILDVRPNGGGDQNLALQVAGRFTSSTIIGSYYSVRNGPNHSDLSSPEPIHVSPRGWTWTKPVAVLSGRVCFSSCEGLISAMRNMPGVIVIGDTTGSGNPKLYTFDNGWQYSVPQWIEYTADMKTIEWNGIAPDIYVKADSTDFAQGNDPVFDYALTWVKNAPLARKYKGLIF